MLANPSLSGRIGRAFALGVPGVLVIPFAIEPPPGVPALALAINPLVLLALAALAGAWAAPRAGLTSSLVMGSLIGRPQLPQSAALGVAAGAVVAALDAFIVSRESASSGLAPLIDDVRPARLLLGVLYGGLTEEVLMRWGLMSLLLLGLSRLMPWRVAGRLAVGLAALAFALAHLPAVLMTGADATAPVLLRTLGWNGALGLLFGALFLRRGLEAAMLAHAGFHVGLAVLAVAMG